MTPVATHGAVRDAASQRRDRRLPRTPSDRAPLRAACPAAGAAIAVGVDRIDAIVETLGREAADELMAAIHLHLSASIGSGDALAAVADAGFTVLCESSDRDRALALADRLVEAVAAPIVIDEHELFVTAGAGIAFAGREASATSLVRDASAALHRGQRRASGRVEVFDAELRTHALDRLRTASDLHRGIENGELRVVYQPLVSLRDRSVVGVESLVRWAHPTRGLIAPARFLPIAEQSGMITRIGAWVLREACRQAASWSAAYPDRRPLKMTVNVSTQQLVDRAFVTLVAETLAATQIAPRQLALDITEGAFRDDPAVPEALHELKALGVRLFLDDFVTGNAALTWLTRFPLDGLKLEAPFVRGLGTDPKAPALLEAVCGMAAAFDLEVVAEGVETEEQAAILGRYGCDVAQGYLFSRPVPAAQIDELLASSSSPSPSPAVAIAAAAGAPATPRHAAAAATGATVAIRDAAEALGVSASTVRRWAESGRLTVVRTEGGHRRFLVDEIRRLGFAARADSPTARGVQPPDCALPRAAALLREHGTSVVNAGLRATYAARGSGWFAEVVGRGHVDRWLRALGDALASGRYAEAIESTASLMQRSRLAGTTIVEQVTFLERSCAALLRLLDDADDARAELPAARRVCAALRHRALETVDQPL
ncbi:MAG: hypothetical protein QOJ35_1349 [Solirubrobacteraceae bacterium]|jgi:excisionase family DNA binding protein|nr:hypothetical protein [Solirubrobacteraceae bacterium]